MTSHHSCGINKLLSYRINQYTQREESTFGIIMYFWMCVMKIAIITNKVWVFMGGDQNLLQYIFNYSKTNGVGNRFSPFVIFRL